MRTTRRNWRKQGFPTCKRRDARASRQERFSMRMRVGSFREFRMERSEILEAMTLVFPVGMGRSLKQAHRSDGDKRVALPCGVPPCSLQDHNTQRRVALDAVILNSLREQPWELAADTMLTWGVTLGCSAWVRASFCGASIPHCRRRAASAQCATRGVRRWERHSGRVSEPSPSSTDPKVERRL